ncbi:UPF0496 protein At4g34320-like [Salvia miltiorrhiza]|uniref:UPF0496 protein At4g34320-like n=1 Tax=Salvia miltiorrhiza TaxID=226208 RepID=UPI0025AC9920|nr:UPF0496 protein At4g34320-like [Salvia miltiorrhiza]
MTAKTRAIDVNSYEHQLQTNQQFVMAFLDLQKNSTNNEKLLEFVDNFYADTLKTPELCAALQQRLIHPTNNSPSVTHRDFFHHLSCLYKQQLMMRVTLRSFHTCSDQKLHRIDTGKKVSAVFFTAAAAIAATVAAANANTKKPAAAVAAAASILLVALGKWIGSVLRKRERDVKKHMEIIRVMNIGAKISMKDLTKIHVVAQSLQLETESLSGTDGDGEKVMKSLEELRGKANDYCGNMKWARQGVLQSINASS